MIDASTKITVTLEAQQWSNVLTQLAEGPFKTMAPVINIIQSQCMEYDASPSMHMPRRPGGGANGADPHTDP